MFKNNFSTKREKSEAENHPNEHQIFHFNIQTNKRNFSVSFRRRIKGLFIYLRSLLFSPGEKILSLGNYVSFSSFLCSEHDRGRDCKSWEKFLLLFVLHRPKEASRSCSLPFNFNWQKPREKNIENRINHYLDFLSICLFALLWTLFCG